MSPFFTIITATYNAAGTLQRLLASLAEQTCRDFELIIQDGASTDETVAIAEAWREKIPAMSLVSEKDTGIYDAWNKALPRIRGQWVLFLGADDLLAGPDVLARAKAKLEAAPQQVLLGGGDIILFSDAGIQKTLYVDIAYAFDRRYTLRMPLPHPSLFTRGSVFASQRFDATFRIAGDYDWILHVWKYEAQALSLGFTITQMALSGISNDEAQAFIHRAEQRRILRKHFPLTVQSAPLYMFLYGETLLFGAKMWCKHVCTQCAWGQRLWGGLQNMRKRFTGQML